jgi:lysophospholipase L1-like esterase
MLSRILAFAVVLIFVSQAAAAEPAVSFSVKAGDVWVMAGDSITAQRQHSNFIEAFFRTRYPDLKLQFRNSGVGGHTMQSTSARFDYDIAAFKPTIVSVELGMNDVGRGDDPKQYIDGAKKLLEQIRSVNARPVLISSSPVNDGSTMDNWKGDRCRRIHPYTEALEQLAADEKLTFVDQYHPLLAMWGANKGDDGKDKIPLGGDPVHPGQVGQYTMAATILFGLGVDRDVSAAVLKADGTVVEAQGCEISGAKAGDGGLSFTRSDDRLPWPIDVRFHAALTLMPEMLDLSRYLLTVKDLPAGEYEVLVNGTSSAVVTAEQLAKGSNMTSVAKGPIAERGAQIIAAIAKLQGTLNNAFRTASKNQENDKRAEAQKEIDAAEAELAKLCRPTPLEFVLRPLKK